MKTPATIDEYIDEFPEETQKRLQQMRATIRKAAPEASEKISWAMPTFFLEGNLVHFAAHKAHVGFYPGSSGIEAFQQELSKYKSSKGAVQFPFDQPLPVALVTRIVKYRVKENLQWKKEKAEKKKAKKKE